MLDAKQQQRPLGWEQRQRLLLFVNVTLGQCRAIRRLVVLVRGIW